MGEGGQEGRKGEGGEAEGPREGSEKGTYTGGEEVEDDEATEGPSNQTESYLNSYGCQVTNSEISCRGIGMSELPAIHDLEASLLDMSGEYPAYVTVFSVRGKYFLKANTQNQTKTKDDHSLTLVKLWNLSHPCSLML